MWKTFRLPHDRPYTLKQRVLHPRRSRLASELHALRDVSFKVDVGEFLGIVGRNGSGKSTMLKCLAGIYQPDMGRIEVSGRVSPFIELGVGFNPELTARDNIVVNAALLGMPRFEALSRFDEIVAFAELERFVDLKLKNYSSGMQVRLGFASMIQAQADIYLVDEVLAVGDAPFQEKCFETFRRLKREGRTVVFVTHDLATVERFCTRAILLDNGDLVADGDPHEVTLTYRQRNIEREVIGAETRVDEQVRWGDGTAVILEAWFEDEHGNRQPILAQGASVTYRVRVRFRKRMEKPIFGVTFKGETGEQVFVTNTMLDGVPVGTFEEGEEAVYSVSFPAHFAEGPWVASAAVAHQDAQRFADWWEGATTVAVRSDVRSAGLVELPHETRLERVSPPAVAPEALDVGSP